jgi:hemerythrin
MTKKLFDFENEFRLGIDEIDNEHVKLIDMLNEVHRLISIGERDQARQYFGETLSSYVNEHFTNEEKFMESIQFAGLEEHHKIHENYKKSFQQLLPLIESYDEAAFRAALSDAFTWIINHIGKTDRRYAKFYFSTVGTEAKAS